MGYSKELYGDMMSQKQFDRDQREEVDRHHKITYLRGFFENNGGDLDLTGRKKNGHKHVAKERNS